MKRRPLHAWSLLALGLALATTATVAAAQSPAPGATLMEQRMTPEEFKAAGLHKLSPEELAALQEWMQRQQGVVAAPAASAPAAPALPAGAAAAGAVALSAADVERIREEAREEGRKEVKETNRGFFDFGSDEPIKSNLVGEFRGFAKGNTYTLANGQVWEQVEPARLEGVRKTDPAVTIKPGLLNVWFLRIDGYNTAAKVRRVK
ncbi:hypothetical protein [Pseudoxanthomonas kaohsiungensis]|uniref:Secreted protein n=1 Tax=Pseudoxanthomonas kaohsiungensis TaxID=283923 RepID=A0ABW3LTL2_9GAMM|nr:hypothetical protein [Pseudoxanthomonas kaohsiungensis]KAF1703760.1 hypothetical protein CSC66_05635 [Pseudoxanthomonas kaohsiungensis]